MRHFDILVIGSGPAGQRAAIQAAKYGKRVGLIDRKARIGGAGLQTGTIPSKSLREIAYSSTMGTSHGMRDIYKSMPRQHNFLGESVDKKDVIIDKQESVILNQLLRNGVSLIPGSARFEDAHTLLISRPHGAEQRLQADQIILATGSRPRRPDNVPFDNERVLDSSSILHMRRLPQTLTVVGGGVIACEFATIYASLGVKVTIIDSHPQILAFLCNDISANLKSSMLNMGINFHMQQRIETIRCDGTKVIVESDKTSLESDCLLYALGRTPNRDGLGLEHLGIEAQPHGWVQVNDQYQTNLPHIYAVGDLIGPPALAATGMEQGRIAAIHACDASSKVAAKHLPMAIYTIPEVAWVGQTTAQLDKQGIKYVSGKGLYRETARGQIIGDNNGLLKVLVDCQSRKLLGVHIVGELASELIHIGQMVMNFDGSVDDLAEHVFNYPTLAECYKTAALACSNQLNTTYPRQCELKKPETSDTPSEAKKEVEPA
ncbi:MAG: Si-specific NAD(P)(+) transhydrogenase [Gammaproteobacteria bacterium]|nr:Si-specific NAD(P)(+) transhydrogenase [Gammaproteobacteria bacterium]